MYTIRSSGFGFLLFEKLFILLDVARNCYFGGFACLSSGSDCSYPLNDFSAIARSFPVMSVVLTPSVLLNYLYIPASLNF